LRKKRRFFVIIAEGYILILLFPSFFDPVTDPGEFALPG